MRHAEHVPHRRKADPITVAGHEAQEGMRYYMRKCQITLKLEMFGDQALDRHRETIELYADANTPHEALSAALYELLGALQAQGHKLPGFGVRQHTCTSTAAEFKEEKKNEVRKPRKAEQEQHRQELWEPSDRCRASGTEQEE